MLAKTSAKAVHYGHLEEFSIFFCGHFARLQATLFKQTYFAFVGKGGNVIFAVNPASVEFEGKAGEEGAILGHFTPVEEKSGSGHFRYVQD